MAIFVTDFPAAWYLLTLVSLAIFAIFTAIRKTIKGALSFGIVCFLLAIIAETIGVQSNLWNYTGGNWPLILWALYFMTGVNIYQITKVLEQKKIIKL